VKQAAIGYSGVPLLTDFNLKVAAASTVALVGPNGSGKTTIINSILGLTPLLSGTCEIQGSSMADRNTRQNVGVIWQDRGLPLGISVRRWMKQIADLYSTEIDLGLAKSLGVDVVARTIRQLSGGEQQRLAIWTALNHHPAVLIMDEPTVGLDESTRNVFYEIVRSRVSSGCSVLLTSHYAQDVSALADEVISLGATTESVAYSAIFSTSSPLVIGEINILEIEITSTGNGYLISSQTHQDLLGIASSIAASQNVSITNFSVVNNV
jgi:ABC-2 type transport system ATP-binding protein